MFPEGRIGKTRFESEWSEIDGSSIRSQGKRNPDERWGSHQAFPLGSPLHDQHGVVGLPPVIPELEAAKNRPTESRPASSGEPIAADEEECPGFNIELTHPVGGGPGTRGLVIGSRYGFPR